MKNFFSETWNWLLASRRKPVITVEGRNGSRHRVVCDWLCFDWGEASVRVRNAHLDITINGQEHISSIRAVVVIDRTQYNIRKGLEAIRSGSAGVMRSRIDWPWSKPQYDTLIELTNKETILCGARVVLTGRVLQLGPIVSAGVLPMFDRVKMQTITLNDIVKMARPAKQVVKEEEKKN